MLSTFIVGTRGCMSNDDVQSHVFWKNLIANIFNYTHERMPALEAAEAKGIELAQLIHSHDIETINKLPLDSLQSENGKGFSLWISPKNIPFTILHGVAQTTANEMHSGCGGFAIGSENILGLILFHAVLNETPQEHTQTVKLLKAMIEKECNPHGRAVYVWLLKQNPLDDMYRDFVADLSLLEVAQMVTRVTNDHQVEDFMQSYYPNN